MISPSRSLLLLGAGGAAISCYYDGRRRPLPPGRRANNPVLWTGTHCAGAADTESRLLQVKSEIEGIYKHYMESQKIPGLSYGVLVDGRLILHGSLGVQSAGSDAAACPVSSDSRFRIASMTKSFTAMAILQLRDRGLLSLDDLVVTYVPELAATPQLCRSLTIRHLLSMKAGLPQDDPWADRLLHQPPDDFRLFLSKGLSPSGPPGIAFEYSNLAYAILGLIISNVAKMPYQQFITQNILAPLGMHDTTFDASTVPPAHFARGHRWEEARWSAEAALGDGSYGAMGGLVTTMGDFAKFAAIHQAAWPADKEGASVGDSRVQVLSAASLRECHLPATHMGLVSNEKHPTQISSLPALLNDASAATTRVAAYGFGLVWTTDSRGVTVVRHSGGLPGYGSEWRFLPHHSLAIVSFANKTYANTGSANAVVMDLLIDKGVAQRAPKKTPQALQMRASQLAKLLAAGFDVNGDSEAALFADNFFLDMPQPLWAKHCRAITDRLSPVASISPVTALTDAAGGTNLLRGEFTLTGVKGDAVKVYFTLTPEQSPRVQEVTLRYAGFKAAGP